MVSDWIPNAYIALTSSNPKDFAKKKRANRSAKLKQCKLNARRKQWLSQVKNKGGCKEEVIGGGDTGGGPICPENDGAMPIQKLEIKPRLKDEIYGGQLSMHHSSDSESSPSYSPTSHSSSLLGRNDSGVNFTASSISSSFSGSMSEEEDEEDSDDDDSCLDDWEDMADALAAHEDKQQKCNPSSEYGSQSGVKNDFFCENDISNENQGREGRGIRQAWRPGDAFRPQSLPNLLNSERQFGRGSVWGCRNVLGVPTSCPICFEDLDGTDSSFFPCLCGFRLCLFCHKRILEEDGRCPGCRKEYDCDQIEGEANLDGGSLAFRLARSCSMITRS